MSADATATATADQAPPAVPDGEKNVITDPATAAILAEFAAFRADADAALEDARRRREAVPADVAAWIEARRLSRPGIRPPDGWPDDD